MDQLPSNAPIQHIQKYLEIDQRARGEQKNNAALLEKKKEVEDALCEWLCNPRNQPFLKIGDQWCEVDETPSKASLTLDLCESIYIIFHKAGHHNQLSVEAAAEKFKQFISQAMQQLGKSQRRLKWSKTRPKKATYFALQQLGSM